MIFKTRSEAKNQVIDPGPQLAVAPEIKLVVF